MKTALLFAAALVAVSGTASASQQLAQQRGCMSCHQIERKTVGPSYKDVAKKYKGDASAEAKLVEAVKKGGKGVWGTVPMPPHPQVKDEEIQSIVQWVLSL